MTKIEAEVQEAITQIDQLERKRRDIQNGTLTNGRESALVCKIQIGKVVLELEVFDAQQRNRAKRNETLG